MNLLPAEFAPALPEIILGISLCVLLLIDMFVPDDWRDLSYLVALAGLVATAAGLLESAGGGRVVVLSGSYVADPLAYFLKLVSLITMAAVFLYSRAWLRDRGIYKGEFYLLSLFALLGIMVLISAASLLTVYLGLELLALSLYALVAFDRESAVGAEAAIKYFLLGAIASGCLLYGMSIVYGVTGTIVLAEIAQRLPGELSTDPALMAGLALVVVGIAFKFGAVPFHMWLPDVYQGAPLSTTLFIGTVPKLAAFALALRMLGEGMGEMSGSWEVLLAIMAVLSLALGNVVAIAQTNIRRMLGYSTIGHVGFILLGFAAGTLVGLQAALFYTVVYVLMAAAAFGLLILLGRRGFDADEISDLSGLNQRSPWFAAMMLLVMVSMIGLPPLAGFYAKWWILSALLDSGHLGLAIAGIVFSVIGAFYYLRVIKCMYFDEAGTDAGLRPGFELRMALSLNALLILVIGLFPDTLAELCIRALTWP